ncbi:DUF6086 family protein [Amycolatopsis sp. NPDC051903]|uniref:DUF6086 family protein n=1 Tax=Amycolatopsis sp. NPDC051903 TaxID=3363936 RepID=UPI00378C1F93
MSQNFDIDDRTVWNPSNGVGLLFVRSSDALAPIVDLPTGISPAHRGANADEWVIDLPVFTAFVDALVDRCQRSTHPILRSLLEGFLATALVLVHRGGSEVPALGKPPGPDASDHSASAGGPIDRAPAGRLAELRAVHDLAMPG